jgi:hypothetical protein
MRYILKKSLVLFVLVIMLTGILPGCVVVQASGSGNVVKRNCIYKDYTKLKIYSGFTVEIKAADTFGIEVAADDNLFKYIIVQKDSDTVSIGCKTGSYSRSHFNATVMMPGLQGVELSDGTHVNVSGFSSSDGFSCKIEDGSALTGSISAGDVVISLTDGSRIELAGTASSLKLTSHDGSHANLGNLAVNNADLTVGDGGTSTINVNGTLNFNLSAGSLVTYNGNPTMGNINLSSGSTLTKKK